MGERGVNLLVRAPHDLVWCLCFTGECSLLRIGLSLRDFGLRSPRPFLELLKFLKLAKEGVVNPGGATGESLLSALRDFEVASSRVLNEARLCQIGLGPMYAVCEKSLLAGGQ